MTDILTLEIREDIKELDENIYFKYLLKSSYFKIIKNKQYSLNLYDIICNVENTKPFNQKDLNKVENLEIYLEKYVEDDLKGKYNRDEYEYDFNYIYTSFPIYLRRKDQYPDLKLELVAIVEARIRKDGLNEDKVTYIFCNDKECLEFISSTTIRDYE